MTAGGKLTAVQKTLLRPPSGREADRRAYIRAYLVELGVPERAIIAEYQTQRNGAVDLYLTNRRVILEIKKAGRLKKGPRHRDTGARPGESAFEQLDRYVRDERPREQLHLDRDADGDLPWIGIVTDGQQWWAWEWEPRQEDVRDAAKENERWQGQRLTAGNLGSLGELLARSKTAGREWATADMAGEFGDVRHDLKKKRTRGAAPCALQRRRKACGWSSCGAAGRPGPGRGRRHVRHAHHAHPHIADDLVFGRPVRMRALCVCWPCVSLLPLPRPVVYDLVRGGEIRPLQGRPGLRFTADADYMHPVAL